MNRIWVLFFLTVLIYSCGCAQDTTSVTALNGASFRIASFTADKAVYHSAELVNLSIVVNSNQSIQGVNVTVNGINGRLNDKRTIDLKEGSNYLSVEYKLPRCNVCGGIKAGNYNLTCKVEYNNISSEQAVVIDVQQ